MLKWNNLELEKGRKLETEMLQGKGALWAWFYIGSILMEKAGKFKGGAQLKQGSIQAGLKDSLVIFHLSFLIFHLAS